MKKHYELLIFDWDGTLMDSEANIVACMKSAIADMSLPTRSNDEIKNIIEHFRGEPAGLGILPAGVIRGG